VKRRGEKRALEDEERRAIEATTGGPVEDTEAVDPAIQGCPEGGTVIVPLTSVEAGTVAEAPEVLPEDLMVGEASMAAATKKPEVNHIARSYSKS